MVKPKGRTIPKEDFRAIIVDDNATDKALADVYKQIIELIRKENQQSEGNLRESVNRGTSNERVLNSRPITSV